jgi:hypothetical protein
MPRQEPNANLPKDSKCRHPEPSSDQNNLAGLVLVLVLVLVEWGLVWVWV